MALGATRTGPINKWLDESDIVLTKVLVLAFFERAGDRSLTK